MKLIKEVKQVDDNPVIGLMLQSKKPLLVFVGTKKLTKTLSQNFHKVIQAKYKNEATQVII